MLHSQKDATDNKPKLTDQEMVGGKDFRTGPKSKLNPPKRKPTESERKKMVAIAMSLIVKKVMTNFLYTFGGEDRKQDSGGPIGDVLTKATSRHMGNEFDELFNDQVVKLGLKQEMYQRYADDIESALRSIGRRMMFCPLDGCMVNKPEDQVEREADLEEDELTLRELIISCRILKLSMIIRPVIQNLGIKFQFLSWLCGWKLSRYLPQGWKARRCTQTVIQVRCVFP